MENTNTPTNVTAPSAAPESGQAVSPAPAQVSSTPAAPASPATPQATDRAAVYAQYYGSQQVEPPATEPTVQSQPTAHVVQSEPEPQTPEAPALPPEIIEVIQGLQQQVQSLQQQLTPPQPPAPASPAEEDDWIALLSQGKKAEGEAALARAIRKNLGMDDYQQQAVQAAVERVQVENEINTFVRDLRTANPELVPMEDLISIKAQSMLEAASPRIKSSSDFVKEYKSAVTKAAEDVRKLYQQIRSAGKEEAVTRNTQVLSSTPVPPNPVSSPREQAQTDTNAQPDTPFDYLAKRKQREYQLRGLSQ